MQANTLHLSIFFQLIAGVALLLSCPLSYSAAAGVAPENPRQNFAETLSPPGISEAELRHRRAMAREYFAAQRTQLDIVATTVTDSGQVIDWIRPGSQVAQGKVASPPPELPVISASGDDIADATLSVSELEQQPHARGPQGTVPVVRLDVDSAINNMVPPAGLEDLLSKTGKAGQTADSSAYPAPGDPNHEYVKTFQSVFNQGSSAYINLWNPYVSGARDAYTSGEFSLGQVAINNQADSAHRPMETIEAGWQDFPAKYGDNYPHFFIYYTTSGYRTSGDYVGGYNRDVRGFVQYSRTVFPGMRLTNTSVPGGAQQELFVAVKKWGSNWWIWVNGEWLGYYPASLFDSDRLGTRGTGVAWYGEVVDVDDGFKTFTDMGSGAHADAGYRNAAYLRNIVYYADTLRGSAVDFVADDYLTRVTDPNCYSLETHFASGGPWRSFFYWGGPGRTSLYTPYCSVRFSYYR